MTERTITIAEAHDLLKKLETETLGETLVITDNDQPLLALMPYRAHRDLLANIESLQTVLEIMLGGATGEHPRPAKAALVGNKSTSWETFKEEVGWE